LCPLAHTANVSRGTDTADEPVHHQYNGDQQTPPTKGTNMNDQTGTGADAKEVDDTEGHKSHLKQPAAAAVEADDTEGHKAHQRQADAAVEADDTEGHKAHQRQADAAVEADDTEGHMGSIKK
jgi:hypothetical protein